MKSARRENRTSRSTRRKVEIIAAIMRRRDDQARRRPGVAWFLRYNAFAENPHE